MSQQQEGSSLQSLYEVQEKPQEKIVRNPVYLPRYEIIRLFLSNNFQASVALESCIQATELDQVCNPLVSLFRAHSDEAALNFIKLFMKREIDNTISESTLFRGTSFATKIISAYCMMEGQDYLAVILEPLLKMFCIDDVSIEVDSNKIPAGENLEVNQLKLLGVCKGLLNHIYRSVDSCAMTLRRMFFYARQLVSEKFPTHAHKVVGGFYFLRFLCPALCCPEGFGIIPVAPSAKSRRSLILVSKVIQNLANDISFGEKEPYMIKMNPFIHSNQDSMVKFLDTLATTKTGKFTVGAIRTVPLVPRNDVIDPLDPTSVSPPTLYSSPLLYKISPHRRNILLEELKEESFEKIFKCVTQYKDKIVKHLEKENQRGIARKIIRVLQVYSTKSTVLPVGPDRLPFLTIYPPLAGLQMDGMSHFASTIRKAHTSSQSSTSSLRPSPSLQRQIQSASIEKKLETQQPNVKKDNTSSSNSNSNNNNNNNSNNSNNTLSNSQNSNSNANNYSNNASNSDNPLKKIQSTPSLPKTEQITQESSTQELNTKEQKTQETTTTTKTEASPTKSLSTSFEALALSQTLSHPPALVRSYSSDSLSKSKPKNIEPLPPNASLPPSESLYNINTITQATIDVQQGAISLLKFEAVLKRGMEELYTLRARFLEKEFKDVNPKLKHDYQSYFQSLFQEMKKAGAVLKTLSAPPETTPTPTIPPTTTTTTTGENTTVTNPT